MDEELSAKIVIDTEIVFLGLVDGQAKIKIRSLLDGQPKCAWATYTLVEGDTVTAHQPMKFSGVTLEELTTNILKFKR